MLFGENVNPKTLSCFPPQTIDVQFASFMFTVYETVASDGQTR